MSANENEYTPEASDVENAYIAWRDFGSINGYAPEWTSEEQVRADFARWLASVKAEAWEAGYEDGASDEGCGHYGSDYATKNPHAHEES